MCSRRGNHGFRAAVAHRHSFTVDYRLISETLQEIPVHPWTGALNEQVTHCRSTSETVGPVLRRILVSFVTTYPEALMAAAGALQHLGTALAAEEAAAVPPITSVAPAAADEVSALQAVQFAAYGSWFQQVSEQANAVHQQLVNTLESNANAYGQTEGVNQSAAGAQSLSGGANAASAAAASPAAATTSDDAIIGTPFNWFQNVGAAASDFIALGQGQFLPGAVNWSPAMADLPPLSAGAAAAVPASAVVGTPVAASVGGGVSLGGMSVPPSWAATGVPAAGLAPATLTGAGWTSAPVPSAPVTTVPAGLPSIASAGRASSGFGAPRYGVKPIVMPKPTVG